MSTNNHDYILVNKNAEDEAKKKFDAVSNQHQQAIQNALDDSQFSDEEEGDIGDNVLSTVFKSYSDMIGKFTKSVISILFWYDWNLTLFSTVYQLLYQ